MIEKRRYLSYLLRLWQVEDGGKAMWRVSVKGIHDGEQMGFASLQDLFRFLRTCTSTVRASEGDGQEPP